MAFKARREILLNEKEITARIGTLAQEIAKDFQQETSDTTTPPFERCLILLCVLQSALPFTLALEARLNQLGIKTETQFIKASSYGTEMKSNGKPSYDISEAVQNKITSNEVMITEDMIDSGITLVGLVEVVKGLKPSSLHVAVLLEKIREALDIGVTPYVGFRIPNLWVDGFGIDSANKNRELPEVWAFLRSYSEYVQWLQFRLDMKAKTTLGKVRTFWKSRIDSQAAA